MGLCFLEKINDEPANHGGKIMAKKKAVKRATKKRIKKGEVYECSVCGLAVTVDEVCGCADACDIICCEKQMKPKKRGAN
jgi:hypothetical protein